MSPTVLVCWTLFALAALPLVLSLSNLRLLLPPPPGAGRRRLSVLIPARDEEGNIAAAIDSVLASRDVDFELVVFDDDSTDATAAIVEAAAGRDARVRLIARRDHDPTRWGKPQACAALAAAARGDVFVFMDADVRLMPDALARIALALERSEAAMLSGIPRQLTPGLAERLVVPLIHFVLLGFLPIAAMRASPRAAFGVACGQLLAVEREAYVAAGGHAAIADRIHDAMALARTVRAAGAKTDLADFSSLASCRMYATAGAVVGGFAKNAHEGLGSPLGILPWTLLLLGGQVAWIVLLPLAGVLALPVLPLLLAGGASLSNRLLLDRRFGRVGVGSFLHPVGVLALVLIQWYALARRLAGRPVPWKARVAAPAPARSAVAGSSARADRVA